MGFGGAGALISLVFINGILGSVSAPAWVPTAMRVGSLSSSTYARACFGGRYERGSALHNAGRRDMAGHVRMMSLDVQEGSGRAPMNELDRARDALAKLLKRKQMQGDVVIRQSSSSPEPSLSASAQASIKTGLAKCGISDHAANGMMKSPPILDIEQVVHVKDFTHNLRAVVEREPPVSRENIGTGFPSVGDRLNVDAAITSTELQDPWQERGGGDDGRKVDGNVVDSAMNPSFVTAWPKQDTYMTSRSSVEVSRVLPSNRDGSCEVSELQSKDPDAFVSSRRESDTSTQQLIANIIKDLERVKEQRQRNEADPGFSYSTGDGNPKDPDGSLSEGARFFRKAALKTAEAIRENGGANKDDSEYINFQKRIAREPTTDAILEQLKARASNDLVEDAMSVTFESVQETNPTDPFNSAFGLASDVPRRNTARIGSTTIISKGSNSCIQVPNHESSAREGDWMPDVEDYCGQQLLKSDGDIAKHIRSQDFHTTSSFYTQGAKVQISQNEMVKEQNSVNQDGDGTEASPTLVPTHAHQLPSSMLPDSSARRLFLSEEDQMEFFGNVVAFNRERSDGPEVLGGSSTSESSSDAIRKNNNIEDVVTPSSITGQPFNEEGKLWFVQIGTFDQEDTAIDSDSSHLRDKCLGHSEALSLVEEHLNAALDKDSSNCPDIQKKKSRNQDFLEPSGAARAFVDDNASGVRAAECRPVRKNSTQYLQGSTKSLTEQVISGRKLIQDTVDSHQSEQDCGKEKSNVVALGNVNDAADWEDELEGEDEDLYNDAEGDICTLSHDEGECDTYVWYVTDRAIGIRTTWSDGYETVEEFSLKENQSEIKRCEDDMDDILIQSKTLEISASDPPSLGNSNMFDGLTQFNQESPITDDHLGDIPSVETVKKSHSSAIHLPFMTQVPKPADAVVVSTGQTFTSPNSERPSVLNVGSVVRVAARNSRYKDMVGTVVSLVGKGKRARVQFPGAQKPFLMHLESLEAASLHMDRSVLQRERSVPPSVLNARTAWPWWRTRNRGSP